MFGLPVSGLQSGSTPSSEAQRSGKAGSAWGHFLVELKELFSKGHRRLVKCSAYKGFLSRRGWGTLHTEIYGAVALRGSAVAAAEGACVTV